jgi:hypothetical protein
MNRKSDRHPLLDDVFAENVPEGFREALLGETLRRVRRRRHLRQLRRAAALVVACGLVVVWAWQDLAPRPLPPAPVAKGVERSYHLVRTHAFPADAVVTTRPLVAWQFVASAGPVRVIPTTADNYRVINDDELLALIAPRPAALVRLGPHSEELIFANPGDEKGFPLN